MVIVCQFWFDGSQCGGSPPVWGRQNVVPFAVSFLQMFAMWWWWSSGVRVSNVVSFTVGSLQSLFVDRVGPSVEQPPN